jgi:hypothetical protein
MGYHLVGSSRAGLMGQGEAQGGRPFLPWWQIKEGVASAPYNPRCTRPKGAATNPTGASLPFPYIKRGGGNPPPTPCA